MAQMIKNLPAMQKTWVQSLVHGYPLQYSCLENSMDRGAGSLQFMESQRVGQD